MVAAAAVSGLQAERTSLLSLGDDACRFQALETDILWPASRTCSIGDSRASANPP
jgi:hypothetical protein